MITTISLSYLFLIIAVLDLIFFIYFKLIVSASSKENGKKNKITGKMKNPEEWLKRNSKMSYVWLFWSVVSLFLFVYLKFFITPSLVSIFYIIGYAIALILSVIIFGIKNPNFKKQK